MKVLLIEDSREAAELMALSLRLAGHDVDVEPDGRAGLAYVHGHAPADAVVCDHYLPGMDGLSLFEELWKAPGWGKVPVVLATGAADLDVSRFVELASHAPVTLLKKPFDPKALIDLLATLKQSPGEPLST